MYDKDLLSPEIFCLCINILGYADITVLIAEKEYDLRSLEDVPLACEVVDVRWWMSGGGFQVVDVRLWGWGGDLGSGEVIGVLITRQSLFSNFRCYQYAVENRMCCVVFTAPCYKCTFPPYTFELITSCHLQQTASVHVLTLVHAMITWHQDNFITW